jgi:hypothetical protein
MWHTKFVQRRERKAVFLLSTLVLDGFRYRYNSPKYLNLEKKRECYWSAEEVISWVVLNVIMQMNY